MTREEIIKELRCLASGEDCPSEKCDNTCPYWTEREWWAALYEDRQLCRAAADMLEQDAQRWISVKDKLPNDDATYLACGCDGYLLADYAGDGEWESFDLTNVTRYVSYWMPLPKEPEEEEK